MSNEKCWVCLRITPEKVLKWAHKVWTDPKIARKMGLEASRIIEQAYHKYPPYLCGKRPNGLIGGLFYILAHQYVRAHAIFLKDPTYLEIIRTQAQISKAIGCSTVTIRHKWRLWINRFPTLFYESEKARAKVKEEFE